MRADARRLPFDDGEFDVVIAAEVLEHIHEDSAAIAELRRVLRPGGLIAVTVPRWWPERVCWALSREYHDVPGGHVRIYRRGQLADRLRRSGLVLAPAAPPRARAALAVLVAALRDRHVTRARARRRACTTASSCTT